MRGKKKESFLFCKWNKPVGELAFDQALLFWGFLGGLMDPSPPPYVYDSNDALLFFSFDPARARKKRLIKFEKKKPKNEIIIWK